MIRRDERREKVRERKVEGREQTDEGRGDAYTSILMLLLCDVALEFKYRSYISS